MLLSSPKARLITSSKTRLNFYSTDTDSNAINNRLLLKTLCEKQKLLVTSNFFFSRNVFYSIRFFPQFVHIFDIISLFAAELEEPKIGVRGKELIKILSQHVTHDRSYIICYIHVLYYVTIV